MRSDRGREERTRGNRLLSPCRIENRGYGAGAIPARHASLTLPD